MAGQTENYHIYYPTDYDEIADVPENDRQQALSIEEALALIDLRNIVGDLTQLETTIKTSVVEAINELKGKTDDIGNITQLETTIKTSVVEAINELKGKTDDIGDITQLETTIKNNLVNAINELKTNTYTKQEVDGKVSSVYKYKGTVASYSNLPSTGLTIGDVYNVEDTGDNYAWTGTVWDKLGGDIDLSEYYTKTQTDNLLEGKADTEDIPDLTDYVKNTDYATNQKGGVVKIGSGSGTDILNGVLRANEYGYNAYPNVSRNAFISKGTLENVIEGKQLVNQETLEESQASQDEIIAKLKADHPDIEEEGTDLSINGTGDFELALSSKGNIEQETREGYQLINTSLTKLKELNTAGTWNNNVYSRNGMTFTINTLEDDTIESIVVNGTSTSAISDFRLERNVTLEAGNYTISGCPSGGSTSTYYISIALLGSTTYLLDTGSTQSRAIDNTVSNLTTRIFIGNGVTLNNAVFKPMITSGSTVKSYEPYGASPSPSFPSPAKVIDGEYEVEVENKNLCKSAIVNATSSAYVDILYVDMDLKPNTTYTISFIGNTNNKIYLNESITTSQYITCNGSRQSLTFTTKSNLDKTNSKQYKLSANGWILFKNNSSNTETPSFDNVQIEYGSTSSPYIAHAQQTQTIDTSPNPLYSENDLYFKAVNGDSFYDSLTSEQKANLESGRWYVHNNYVKDILSLNNLRLNDERDTYWNITAIGSLHYNSDGHLTNNNTRAYCNYFKFGGLDGENKIGVYTNNTYPMMLKSDFPTYEAAAQWLSQHNGEIYLLYPLATPTNTPITNTTLINQLETFQNMLAYQDQTNISQTHNSAQADMKINAKTIMSMRYMQNEIEDIDVSSYQTKITSTNKLNSDLITDTNQINKFVTSSEKAQITTNATSITNIKDGTSIDSFGDVETALALKQDITDTTLSTNHKTIPTAINEVNSIAKGANQALSYGNYSTMITAFNSLANNVYNVGQNVMIITLQVPDLWISGIESTSQTYTYTTDEAFTTELNTNGYVQVGYYKLSALETQKVDLINYVTFDDYATAATTGVVKTSAQYGVSTSSYTKNLTGAIRTYDQYQTGNDVTIICKGTLENVITGKNLESANNKITTISSSSTDNEYPSGKAVYDYIQSLDGDEVSY